MNGAYKVHVKPRSSFALPAVAMFAHTPTPHVANITVPATLLTYPNRNPSRSLSASADARTTMGSDISTPGKMYSPCETNFEGEGIRYCAME